MLCMRLLIVMSADAETIMQKWMSLNSRAVHPAVLDLGGRKLNGESRTLQLPAAMSNNRIRAFVSWSAHGKRLKLASNSELTQNTVVEPRLKCMWLTLITSL